MTDKPQPQQPIPQPPWNPNNPNPNPQPQPEPCAEPPIEERFACEGCGEMVDEVVEDAGMNVLCKLCAGIR